MSSTLHLRSIDPSIWKSIAGTSVQIPEINSRVYYFPQGHAEQSLSTPKFSSVVYLHPFMLCRVVGVGFFANVETDEVFVKMRLVPINVDAGRGVVQMNEKGDANEENDVISFAKVLTPSDSNNGGGFSVPRFCADLIFPPLNFEVDPPLQNLGVWDVHGIVWEFRHIYTGTPRRHLLTTGWSKFVNNKKLVAGDSVVFMRNRNSGEISVGIRRAVKANADCNGRWNYYEERWRDFLEMSRVGLQQRQWRKLPSWQLKDWGLRLCIIRCWICRFCGEGRKGGGFHFFILDDGNEGENGSGDGKFVKDDLVSGHCYVCRTAR